MTDRPEHDVQDLFLEHLQARWSAGHREYRGVSFERPSDALCDEILEEVADIAGWALPLYARVERLRKALELTERTQSLLTRLRELVGHDGRKGHGHPHQIVQLVHEGLAELGE